MTENILTNTRYKEYPFFLLRIWLIKLYRTLTPSALIQYPKTTKKKKPNNT